MRSFISAIVLQVLPRLEETRDIIVTFLSLCVSMIYE